MAVLLERTATWVSVVLIGAVTAQREMFCELGDVAQLLHSVLGAAAVSKASRGTLRRPAFWQSP